MKRHIFTVILGICALVIFLFGKEERAQHRKIQEEIKTEVQECKTLYEIAHEQAGICQAQIQEDNLQLKDAEVLIKSLNDGQDKLLDELKECRKL